MDDAVLSGQGRHRTRAGRRPARGPVLLAKVSAAVLSAVLLSAIGYASFTYRSLDSGITHLHLRNLGAGMPEPQQTAAGSGHKAGYDKDQNILVVGLDSRAGMSQKQIKLLKVGNETSASTDSMMIVHIPADGSKATIISLPRDSYVDIPDGWRKNKLNAAYADAWGSTSGSEAQKEAAGADLLVATVHQLTGLRIDHYAQIGFLGFYKLAQAIHGIDVDMCRATDDTIAHDRLTGQGGGSGFVAPAGKQHLDPLQVFEFVRQRHNLTHSDIDREARQRYFIAAAFRKVASAGTLLDPGKLDAIINAIKGMFVVDDTLRGSALTRFIGEMADLNADKVTGHPIPTEGGAKVDGQDVELVDPAKVKSSIQKLLYPTAATSPPPASSHTAATHSPAADKPADAGCIY